MSQSKSIGEQNYEQFARRYAEYAKTKPHNALYERPATLSLLPDVAGKRVLDVGCGPGIYAEWLVNHGAEVVAFDVMPEFVGLTRQRVGDRATVLRADLNQPLAFAADASFDLVLCPLVFDYFPDLRPLYNEFYRVLKPGGALVFSCGHPFGDWLLVHERLKQGEDYFNVELFEMPWTGFGDPAPIMKGYRRPLQELINPMLAAGFILDRLLEPQPVPAFQQADPERYDRLMRQPGFICVRAYKHET
ncbi:MAG: class I SAM-dependent methyltransferase [Chloroflexi bacterium]|nr:class I SAM-dependent methyltransferase [Chloroflexota bacterium]